MIAVTGGAGFVGRNVVSPCRITHASTDQVYGSVSRSERAFTE